MLTRCPHCKTAYRLQAEQLQVARGRVQCGRCATQFDALDHLLEESLVAATVAPSGPPGRSATPTLAASLDETLPPVYTEPAAPLAEASFLPTRETEISNVQREDQEPSLAIDEAEPEPGLMRVEYDPLPGEADVKPDDILLQDIPRFLLDRDDAAARGHQAIGEAPHRRTSALWGIGAALLFVCLLGQVIWFERDTLLGRFPQLPDLWQQLCEGRACAPQPQRDLDALQILARDVRDHPRYQSALLVNATLFNEASFAQPFPVLELTLFDQAGRTLGVRRFQPGEYLDTSVPVDAGMKPRQQVYIALEIAGIGEEAVSFEFKFL
ncbi:MAG: DUF3426 domain-containing protein [Chromatiales bacterium]